MVEPPPTNLKYEKQKKIGSGTFGTVFIIKRKRDGKVLVMKEQDIEF